MDMPFTHRDPRFTMWSKSPSMVISLPSRTDGDHAAAARAEVAGGSEFRYFGKLPFLCRCTNRSNVNKTTDREADATPCGCLEPLSTRSPSWTRGRFKVFGLHLPYFVFGFTLV